MKRILIGLSISIGLLYTVSVQAQIEVFPYQDPRLPAEQRADDLLGRLTLEEKVSLMMNGSPAIKRLAIPQFEWWSEALHGIGRNGFATVFPITTAMAASWNDALVYRCFAAASDEARAKNNEAKRRGEIGRYQGLSFWTPNINIFRDPRWGRGQETYGEDPWLTSRMGVAVVRGLQGVNYNGTPLPDGNGYLKLLACAKHFAVHSGPEWNRHEFNIERLPERDLWETYLPAFKALVQEADVREVMCAYQRIDGDPCCGNNRYEQHILRDQWGFNGIITSDCGAINDFYVPGRHGVSTDAAAASAKGVLSGTDVECGSSYEHLPEAVQRGEIKEADIDRSLRRLLIERMRVGDFDPDELVPWTKIGKEVVASPEHKQLALDIARQSIVLLKNDGLLPLSSEEILSRNSSLIIMGPNANDSTMLWGNYTGYPTQTTTILQGIRKYIPDAPYIRGCGFTRNEIHESRFDMMRTPDGQPGMQATYWNNTEWQGIPAATTVMTEPINQSNGGATVFAPGVNLENFSARYEGIFTPTRDEVLTLREGSDDKIRIYVNDELVIEQWKSRHRIDYKEKEMTFKAGESYRIRIDYVQLEDMAAMQFDLFQRTIPTKEELLSQIGTADTIIFVGGISPQLEGEEMKVDEPGFKGGDRTSIELPQVQRDLLRILHEAGKRIIFINCSGGAMALAPEVETCDAMIQAWYGGEQAGQAVAEVLFGDYNPSGKLPLTFYRSTNDLPDFLDYRMTNRTYRYFKGKALFPFGYGLSYTTFEIGEPEYIYNKVRISVKNTGSRDGDEVIQVYIRHPADKNGPLKTLRAFQRVSLKAGETKHLTMDFPHDRFECWDSKTNTMRVIPGHYQLMVGTSSRPQDLNTIKVKIK
ncbi:MAG: glycoside hydrolase family 3 C-terminal domain-containing protein [Prevotella sp.]|nr:glycoside hydrolase family 3 C-terminal domain-containing protein [Prevotella sp.]